MLTLIIFHLINGPIVHVNRDHPQVLDVDMLHAPDYSSFELDALKSKMSERKKRDSSLQSTL